MGTIRLAGLTISTALALLALPAAAASADVTELISADTSGVDSINSSAFAPSISADGRYVAFQSEANDLAPGETDYDTDVFVRDRETGVTERVSVPTGGGEARVFSGGYEGASYSGEPSISADGRYVVFQSIATNLAPNGTASHRDAFIHDRQTGVTERVSVDRDDPSFGANDEVQGADISADGRYVVFSSLASNLVTGLAPVANRTDVFLFDRDTGSTTRVSVSIGDASRGGNDGSALPAISGNGRFVAFASTASDLVDGDLNNAEDIFVYDRTAASSELVSLSSTGAQASGTSGFTGPSITSDGRFVAFDSFAGDLVGSDSNGSDQDLFLRDRDSGTTELVSLSSSGAQADGDVSHPSISADGQKVAFASNASNLIAADHNNTYDIFLRDRATGETERVSNSVDGGDPEGFESAVAGKSFLGSQEPGLSADGRYVTFSSEAFNLTPDAVNDGADDVFVTDRDAEPPPADGGGGGFGDGGGGGGTGDGTGGDPGSGGGTGGDPGGDTGGSAGDTGGFDSGGGPDTTPPRVLVDPPSSQKLAKKIKLEVGCSEPCTVTVGGTLKTGKGKKGKSKLTPAESELAAGQSAVLKPKISKQGLKAAKKTVAKGKSVSAKLTVAVTDQAGNTTNDVIKEKLVGKR